jgi:2-polyprenyl-3-methyl-5-hydroxy-6-metoxy-1,4-benzoquinol methylase
MGQSASIDQGRMEALLGRVVTDFGATLSTSMAVVGDKLGLYKAVAKHGPLDSQKLASITGTHERYVRDWLVNQAAGGYLMYDQKSDTYSMTPEQTALLADEGSPYFVAGGFQLFSSALRAEPRVLQNLRSGEGMFWTEHDPGLFEGTERFFRPGYEQNLVKSWIPALEGIEAQLKSGVRVADIGCGHGASTIIMAKAYPKSRFWGFDFHDASIARARQAAEEAGVSDRVRFERVGATEFPGESYALITYFDCLHDLPAPVESIRQARSAITPDGAVLIVEPMATEDVAGNLNPIGRIYSAASVYVCMPNAVAGGGVPLGTLASEKSLREVVNKGGFPRFRRVTETPFNRIFEARP